MIKNNSPQFFLSFFYLLTAFLILDLGYILLKPFIYGYHFVYFLDLSIKNNTLSWIILGICIVIAILLRSPNKSFLQMIYNKEKFKESFYGIGVFSILFFCMILLILSPYVSDIIYDYKNNQCLESFWYCFSFFK
tara:strand:+ start:363 stop:767 length:405 start_codon:yes stop_codon:yes gene_type:complete